jgi:arylsulfatase A-like enzyme
MKNFLKFSLLAIFTITVLLASFYLLKMPEKSFYRVDFENFKEEKKYFRVDEEQGKIFFKRRKEETLIDEIPTIQGTYFFLNGSRDLKILPQLLGEVGLYTYIYFENFFKNKIHFSLEIDRKGTIQRIDHIVTDKTSFPLFRKLDINRKDRILIKFRGSGIVYFSRPILYKIKDFSKRENIILIGVDTLRGDHIGIKVAGRSLTPNIDRFIQDSTIFTNAYAQSSWTIPSFISLFTGLHEYNHKVDIKNTLSLGKPHLIREISKKFITFAYHGGMALRGRWGYSRGFDYYKEFHFTGPLYPRGGQSLFEKASELLETSNFPRLFLFLHTYQVHDPYTPPKNFLLKINKNPKHLKLDAVNNSKPWKTYTPVDNSLRRALKELYQAEILAFDAYFGEFIKRLKELNLYKKATIILMSDHGEEFYEHKGWQHSHSLYNELVHVPFIIKFPNNRYKHLKFDKPVGIIDILPTLLSLYNIEYDQSNIDGVNLLPAIEGRNPRNHLITSISQSRYIEAIPPKFAIFFDHYKLIYNYPSSDEDLEFFRKYGLPPQCPEIELYDLNEDWSELRNIAHQHPLLIKKNMPLILKIKRIIKINMTEQTKTEKKLDEETKKQLKSLGYI